MIKTLHSSIRQHDLNLFKMYEEAVKSRPPTTLRDTLEFTKGVRSPIPLDEVESAESIMKRFCTGSFYFILDLETFYYDHLIHERWHEFGSTLT